MKRRQFLQIVPAFIGLTYLTSCKCIPDDIKLLFEHYQNNDINNPLIDFHAHFFNGKDLQVKEFVKKVLSDDLGEWGWLARAISPLLQNLAWTAAPSAKLELKILKKLKNTDEQTFNKNVNFYTEKQFLSAKKEINELIAALLESKTTLSSMSQHEVSTLKYIQTNLLVSEEFKSYKSMNTTSDPIDLNDFDDISIKLKMDIKGAIKFVFENFQYRSISALNYLKTYSKNKTKFDLIIHHIVDYDWWLANGKSTPSSIQDQINCFSEIVSISNNLVGYFVPFCPLRQALWDNAISLNKDPIKAAGFNPIEQITDAIQNKGAIGVKIYPPMGFSIWGNKTLQHDIPDLWANKKGLPLICKDNDFGQQLDDALLKLYKYCEIGNTYKNGIPIMAHSNASNLIDTDFKAVFNVNLWKPIFNKLKLKMCFAHFGGFGNEVHSKSLWFDILTLMIDQKQKAHSKVYVDTAFYSSVLDNQSNMSSRFKDIIRYNKDIVLENFMYGSDWKMMLTQKNSNNYLKEFKTVLDGIQRELNLNNQTLTKNLLGRNAKLFLQK